ncbi:ABC transporter substrate-binding protein [Microbacterium tumbae]
MRTRNSRVGVIAGMAVAVAFALTACGTPDAPTESEPENGEAEVASSFAGETLTLATDANYPPCQFFEEGSDEMIGYEVELWDAIAEKLGVTLEIENTQFASLIPGVQSGRYDLAMECISDSAEREEQVSFVNYIYDKTAAVTLESYEGPITEGDPLSLCGQTMGAQTGFDTIDKVADILNPECEADGRDPVVIQEYPNAADTYSALNSERIDFLVLGTAGAAYMAQTAASPVTYWAIESFPQKYLGAAIAPDDAELQDAWLAGLEAVIADGTYDKILADWGMEILALEEPGNNLATTRPLD